MVDLGGLAVLAVIGIGAILLVVAGGIGAFLWWLDVWWVTAAVLVAFACLVGRIIYDETRE